MVGHNINASVSMGWSAEINCGKKALKNIIALGLPAATTKSFKNNSRLVAGPSSSPRLALVLLTSIFIPITARASTPSHLIIKKKVSELAIITPRPASTKIIWMKLAQMSPSAVKKLCVAHTDWRAQRPIKYWDQESWLKPMRRLRMQAKYWMP